MYKEDFSELPDNVPRRRPCPEDIIHLTTFISLKWASPVNTGRTGFQMRNSRGTWAPKRHQCWCNIALLEKGRWIDDLGCSGWRTELAPGHSASPTCHHPLFLRELKRPILGIVEGENTHFWPYGVLFVCLGAKYDPNRQAVFTNKVLL
jgi:hypothetical protein